MSLRTKNQKFFRSIQNWEASEAREAPAMAGELQHSVTQNGHDLREPIHNLTLLKKIKAFMAGHRSCRRHYCNTSLVILGFRRREYYFLSYTVFWLKKNKFSHFLWVDISNLMLIHRCWFMVDWKWMGYPTEMLCHSYYKVFKPNLIKDYLDTLHASINYLMAGKTLKPWIQLSAVVKCVSYMRGEGLGL